MNGSLPAGVGGGQGLELLVQCRGISVTEEGTVVYWQEWVEDEG
jgi:hypothetical protein